MPPKPPNPLLRASSALGRFRRRPPEATPEEIGHSDLDRWLVPLFGPQLEAIEGRIEGRGAEGYREFRELDDDLWSLLLTLEYDAFPGIRSFLPELPPRAIQEQWNGASGPALAAQGVCFYRKLKEVQARHGRRGLAESAVLDFGCGWGRLTRMLARDVDPGGLFGCDPVEEILEACRRTGVPAELARSEFLPERLPFDQAFDLVFAFSVLTHVSERSALALLGAIESALEPGGLFVFTIRPSAYLDVNPLMEPAVERLGPGREELDGPAYVFVPHDVEEEHPQYDGTEMSYGEAVVTLPWIEQNAPGFELADVAVLTGDIYQVVVTLRKR
ncbi:MAG: class I SAM-dependent methyltransferase [Solirubrobacterales bacterium]|nr:class I SAM-dependent methyltransferase [Solirubrobacterales bacterium]